MDPRRRRLILASLPIIARPPIDATKYVNMILRFLIHVCRTPPDPMMDIRHRLFANDEVRFIGRDVFTLCSGQRYEFFEMTGETPETFLQLLNLLDLTTRREHTLSVRNRVLLAFIWLRSYPCYSFLSAMFNVSLTTVTEEIKYMINILHEKLSHFIIWPTIEEWRNLRHIWSKIPAATGAIDGTSHKIYRPMSEPQEQYYSGHRHYHAMHTQIIVDNAGIIRYIESGFLGHQNDAQQFQMMRQIGIDLPFPDDCFLLGDKIYPNRHPIMTPFSAAQIRRKVGRDKRKCTKLNKYICHYRITVEHSIAELKCYKSVSSVWRHSRQRLSRTVHVCASLVCRRKHIGLIV